MESVTALVGSDAKGSWKHHRDLQVATCIDSKVILITITRRQGPPFEDAAKVHRHWDLAMLLKFVAALCKCLTNLMAICDNPTTISEMSMLMTCLCGLYDKFMTHFGGVFDLLLCLCGLSRSLHQIHHPPSAEAAYLDRNGSRSHL